MKFSDISIEQLETFASIADTQSFSETGKRLHKTQSTVSYTLSKLEQTIGTSLFIRTKRKVNLSTSGVKLLPYVKNILQSGRNFIEATQDDETFREDMIHIVVDAVMDIRSISHTFHLFHQHCCPTRLQLSTHLLEDVYDTFLSKNAHFAFTPMANLNDVESHSFGSVELIPIISPRHDLAQKKRITKETLLNQTQIIMRTNRGDQGIKHNIFSERQWSTTDWHSKIELIKAGLGFGFAPKHMIKDALDTAELIELNTRHLPPVSAPIYFVRSRERPLGPSGIWLFERILEKTHLQ